MRALTIQQPWATLIARGRKSIETRSWPAPPALIGQRLAIHAGVKAANVDVAWEAWTAVGISHDGLVATRWPKRDRGALDALPLGAVVATVRVAECLPMVVAADEHDGDCFVVHGDGTADRVSRGDEPERYMISAVDEVPLGHFEPGRFGWIFDAVEQLEQPVPVRGAQRLCEWPR